MSVPPVDAPKTEVPLVSVGENPFMTDWANKANALPTDKRQKFLKELDSLHAEFSQSAFRWEASATGLSTCAIATKDKLNDAAQKLFEKYQCTDKANALKEYFAKTDESIAAARQMQFTTFEKTKTQRKPSPYEVQQVKGSIVAARAVAAGIEVVDAGVSATINAVKSGVEKVCSINSTTKGACDGIAQTASAASKPIVEAAKMVNDKIGVDQFINKLLDENQKINQRQAKQLSEQYGIPLELTKQYINDVQTIFTGILFMGVAKKGADVAKKMLPKAPPSTGPATSQPAASSTSNLGQPLDYSVPKGRPRGIDARPLSKDLQAVRDELGGNIHPFKYKNCNGEIFYMSTLENNNLYRVHVGFLHGEMNIFEVLGYFKNQALSHGATTLKITATIVNKDLKKTLKKRFNYKDGSLEIPLK